MQVEMHAAVRTLDDVTIISEATARAIQRLKQEEESEQEQTISCTASSTPFPKPMMCPTWLQLSISELLTDFLRLHICYIDKTYDCSALPVLHPDRSMSSTMK